MLRVVIALVALCAVARAQPAITKPPKLVQAVAPEYPPAALAAGKQADVNVRIHIDAAGLVSAVDVLAPVGDGFDEAAVAAAKQYVFEPAEVDGKPTAIAVETTIHFVIEQQPAPEPAPVPTTTAKPAASGPPNHAGPMTAPVVLHGVALERGTRRRIAGVIVAIEELGLDAVTADDGSFYFHGVAPGTYKVLAVDARFERFERTVELAKHESLEVRLWMRPLGGNPYETVVEGERDQLEVTKRTLDREQLTSVPGTFGDPIRAMETLPGIARTPFGLGFLLVRGSDPQDTGIFVDGHEVPALFHFLGGPSIFNAEMLESLDFYPGGFPGRFGRHHGGVVSLETRPTASDGVHGSAKVDALDAGGYLRAPITNDITFAVAARRSYIDALLPFVLPLFTSSPPSVVAPIYDDYQARVDWNLHDNGHASVFVLGSDDALRVVDRDPNALQTQSLSSSIDFLRIIAAYTRPLGDTLKLTISPSWGQDSVTLAGADAASTGPFNSLDVIDHELGYRMRVDGHVSERVVLDTGLDVLSRVTTYSALAPNDQNIVNPTGINVQPTQILRGSQELGVGGYVDLGIDVTKRLRVIPSLRIDGYILDGEYRESVDPRLVVKYQLDPMWLLKTYAGRFSEPPEPEALDKAFGNPKVGLEHGYEAGIGFEFRPDHVWSVDGEVWGVERLDRVVFTNDVQANADGTFSYINFCNCATEHAYGVEFLIKRQITPNAYGWLSYTFSRSFQSQEGGAWQPTFFDQPHVLNAVASYKPGHGWELGGRVQMASGRPDTPIIGATFDADLGQYVPVMGTPSSVRDPTFFELDTRVEHTWLFRLWRLGAYLDVLNALNVRNVEAYQYDYRYRERAPITSYPILPNLGVRGAW